MNNKRKQDIGEEVQGMTYNHNGAVKENTIEAHGEQNARKAERKNRL